MSAVDTLDESPDLVCCSHCEDVFSYDEMTRLAGCSSGSCYLCPDCLKNATEELQ